VLNARQEAVTHRSTACFRIKGLDRLYWSRSPIGLLPVPISANTDGDSASHVVNCKEEVSLEVHEYAIWCAAINTETIAVLAYTQK